MNREGTNHPNTRRFTLRLPTLGLSSKVAIVVIIGTLSMIGLFAYLGTAALSENTRRNLQERVILAQMTASYIDALLDNIEDVLTHTTEEGQWTDPLKTGIALDQAYTRLGFFASRVFLVDRTGVVVAARPTMEGMVNLSSITPVIAALDGTTFAVSHVPQSIAPLGPCVFAAAAIRDSSGNVAGALAITLSFTDSRIRAFSNPIGLGETGYMDLVTLDGQILASTKPARIGSESDHGSILSGMIRDHRQAVSACHDCHTPLAGAGPLPEVLAFAPLDRVQWGVTVHQSEDEVFFPTRSLQSRIVDLMVIMLGGALVLVYFATRSVIVPVKALTEASQRIAEGDLDSPIKAQGSDEVGVLARSFDQMRMRLKNTTEEIQAWNRELDARVQERTAAYEAAAKDNARLYAELEKKEQLRGELLRRVISAQEDERKRIARELHDETSQGLSALMVGLDTVQVASTHDVQKASAHLQNSKAIAKTLLENIHRLIADLRPTLLDDLGLVPATSWYGVQRLKPLQIAFQMSGTGLTARLPTSIETVLYRIVQEAITNIVRHAHASVVEVQFERQPGYVILQVSDNGKGFDPQTVQASRGQGLGLRGMQERAIILGGEFQIQTVVGKGTIITVSVPVPD